MAARAEDHLWFQAWSRFALGYCLTVVDALGPDEVLARLGAERRETGLTLEDVDARCWDAWDDFHSLRLFVGAAQVGTATVMVEVNGYVGVTEGLMAGVSAGTRSVAHYLGGDGMSRFLWMDDGEVQLSFEPLFPESREGRRAGEVEALLRSVGFDLAGTDESRFGRLTATTLALAAEATGLELTQDVLEDATYSGGLVTLPA